MCKYHNCQVVVCTINTSMYYYIRRWDVVVVLNSSLQYSPWSQDRSSLQYSPWSQDRLQYVVQPERLRNDRNASKKKSRLRISMYVLTKWNGLTKWNTSLSVVDRALAVRTGTEMLTEIRDLSVLVKKIADIILIYMYINIPLYMSS